jgi:hypothetical protein
MGFSWYNEYMKKTILIVIGLVLIGGISACWFFYQKPKVAQPTEEFVKVEGLQPNQEIQSPYIVKGQAVGSWFFEGTFPVKLLDETGNIIKQTYAQTPGEWMTKDFIPFESILLFSVSKDQKGTLVLQKDNPSGMPQFDAEIRIAVMLKAGEKSTDFSETGNLIKDNPGFRPGTWYVVYEKQGAPALNSELKFNTESLCQINSISQSCPDTSLESGDRVQVTGWKINGAVVVKNMAIQKTAEQTRKVKLYYYNSGLDKDSSGNILCSRKGLVAVEREIPVTITPIQDTINLLISGNLTSAEKAQGISTEYPLQGFSLKGAALNGSALKLEFDDPYNKTGGGSCRVGILWFQIEATAKQFAEVQQVSFLPEELFQP